MNQLSFNFAKKAICTWIIVGAMGVSLGAAPAAAQVNLDNELTAHRLPVAPLDLASLGSGEPLPNALSPREIYQRALQSVALLINRPDGSISTAWVVDTEKRLLLTNQHSIEGTAEVELLFPSARNGELLVDMDQYKGLEVHGRVVDSDKDIDLALVQVENLPASVQALPLAPRSASPGERVHAVGGQPRGSFGMWKYSTGFVSQVSVVEVGEDRTMRFMQSNIDLNKGNSGGPIIDDLGRVVAVSESYDPDARDVTNNVDVETVRSYVELVTPLLTDPTPQAMVELGRRHLDDGRSEIAMQMFTNALRRNPELAEAHAQRGRAFSNNEDFVTAINDFTAAIELDKMNSTAWYGRALAYRRLKDFDKAVQDYSLAITYDPNNAGYYNQRAIVQESREEYRLALSDYARALKLEPGNPQFLANRADLWVNLKEYDNALEDARQAVQAAPRFAWAHAIIGRALVGREQFREAADAYYSAYQLDKTLDYLVQSGENVQRAGDHELGVQVWTEIMRIEPNKAYNVFSRGWSHRRLNNLQAAVRDFTKAIKMNNSQADYYQERGLAFEALGDQQAAHEDFAQAAQLNPEKYGSAAHEDNSAVVGHWYVNQRVNNGSQIEMTQHFHADGNYQATMYVNGKRTDENGTYRLQGDEIVFKTNLGNYSMKYKFQDGMLWILFNDVKTWLGSVRK